MKSPLSLLLSLLFISSVQVYAQELVIDPDFNVGTGFGIGAGGEFGVAATVVQVDGKILVGGAFGSYNGTTVKNLVRLNTNGTLDNTFAPSGTGFNGRVAALALQPDGKVIVGGYFSSYNGIAKKNILRLNNDGTLDDTFDAGDAITGTGSLLGTRAIALQPDGKIVVAGSIIVGNSNATTYVKRLTSTGGIDASFQIPAVKMNAPSVDISSIKIQANAKILIAGFFNSVNNFTKPGLARLNSDGTLDEAFPANQSLQTPNLEVLIDEGDESPNGKTSSESISSIYAGGFIKVSKLTSSGEVDPSFTTDNAKVTEITALAIRNGQILVGFVRPINDVSFYRLKSNGAVDANMSFYADGAIETIVLPAHDQILVSGSFTTIGQTSSKGIARLLVRNEQVLTFKHPGIKKYGDAPFDLEASSSEGMPITFTSSNTSVLTISGKTATITGIGSTLIKATAEGNGTFAAAEQLQLVIIDKAPNTITFNEIPTKTAGDSPFDVMATASSQLPVTLTSTSDEISLAGSHVTILKPGKVTIKAEQAGNEIYAAAQPKEQVFCINPLKPTITSGEDGAAQVTLTSSNDSGNQWLNEGGVISGATGKSLEVTATGNYSVITTIDGCPSVASEPEAVAINGVGDRTLGRMNVLGNPVRGQLVVEVSSDTDHEVSVEVVDMLGRMVVTTHVRSNTVSTINIAHVADGIHVIRASSPYVNLTARILKKN